MTAYYQQLNIIHRNLEKINGGDVEINIISIIEAFIIQDNDQEQCDNCENYDTNILHVTCDWSAFIKILAMHMHHTITNFLIYKLLMASLLNDTMIITIYQT